MLRQFFWGAPLRVEGLTVFRALGVWGFRALGV